MDLEHCRRFGQGQKGLVASLPGFAVGGEFAKPVDHPLEPLRNLGGLRGVSSDPLKLCL